MSNNYKTGQSRIFITGGASGLGRALAERFAAAGYAVCIGDIHAERGEETLAALQQKTAAHFLACNVQREEDLQAAADWLREHWGGVDIVVNNAGVAAAGNIDALPLEDWQWVMDINVLGVVRGSKVFTALMKEQGHGHIVNIASLAGLIHPPKMAAYCASKAAVVAISESMSLELADDNIGVSVVCPAFFRTNLAESARASDADSAGMTNRLVNKAKIGAEEIANYVFEAVQRGDHYILTHAESRRLFRLKRLVPFSWYRRVMLKGTSRMAKKRG